ncbi:molybdopterin binding motif [Sporolactobacillus inulinus]|uniref:Molybdopterin binding motif n=1 Tax=Sporolactobacillus inulinus TaxID=2078 RepID=A0A4Y1Z6M9_9BACL|nr:molybdopterin binding motif [Sporolactobacillus inulinus]
MAADWLAAYPGASSVLNGGVVCYTNQVKNQVLHVPESILNTEGAVSAACAEKWLLQSEHFAVLILVCLLQALQDLIRVKENQLEPYISDCPIREGLRAIVFNLMDHDVKLEFNQQKPVMTLYEDTCRSFQF